MEKEEDLELLGSVGIVEVAEGKGEGISEEGLEKLLLKGSNFSQGGVAVAIFNG